MESLDNATAIDYAIQSLAEPDMGDLHVGALSANDRDRVNALIDEMRGKGSFAWNARMIRLKRDARKFKLGRSAEGRLLELGLIAWRACDFIASDKTLNQS